MNIEFNQKIQLIKEKVNIIDIIGSYLKLLRKGSNFWAVCPFHEDSSPSLSVSQEKQIYKCFSCGEQGNVFIFLQKYKNIDFISALKEVAKIVNIDLKDLNIIAPAENKKHPFKELNYLAINYFQYQLTTQAGKEALNYLKTRGISNTQIDDFAIGYAPKENELIDYLKMQGYEDTSIIEAGLAKINEKDKITDMFINRIIFPIIDFYGDCLGFSGRRYITKINDNFKYINTPETQIFKKGKVLYNLFNAKNAIHNNNDSIYLVEGYMDVIALNSQNIKNCVAIMGTSLTKEQIIVLKKITNNTTIFLDGDEAGKIAAYKVATTLLLNKFNVKIVDNFSKLDPDELINKNLEEFNLIFKKTLHPIEFAINFFSSKYDINKDSYQLKEFLSSLKPIWQVIEDQIALKFYLNYLTKLTNLSENELIDVLNKEKEISQTNNTKSKKYEKPTIKNKLLVLQKQLVFLLLISRKVYLFLEKEKFIFCNQKLMNLYFLINQKYSEDENLSNINLDILLLELKENEIYPFLNNIIEKCRNKKYEVTENNLQDYLQLNKNYTIELEIEVLNNQIANTENIQDKIELLKKISNLKNQLRVI